MEQLFTDQPVLMLHPDFVKKHKLSKSQLQDQADFTCVNICVTKSLNPGTKYELFSPRREKNE